MTKQLTIDILAKDKTKQALTGVRKNLNNVKNSVFSLKGALVGLGAGAIIKSFVDVGKEVESLQVRFKFLFGSIEEGKVAFDSLTDFAGRVPFSLEEISRASGNLAVVAKDAQDLNRVLEITGNVAAVTGLDFETTSSQIQRAFSGGIGAADLFRERGVRALLGFQAGAKVTAEETIARFEELFAGDGQFANATKDLATTLEGTISMIGDKYFKFQKDVAAGFFDELKGEFGDLNQFLEANEQQIQDIATAIGENFAGAITKTSDVLKTVAPAVKTISDALGTTITGFTSLPPFVRDIGLISALLFGKKGAIAFTAVSFLVGQIEELMAKADEMSKRQSFLNIKDIEEAESKLSTVQTALSHLEKTLGDRGIDVFNLESLDTTDFSDGVKSRIALILQYRQQIDELNFSINNIKAESFKNFLEETKVGFTGMTEKIVEFNQGFQTSIEDVNKQASAFGDAYMTSVLLAEKTTDDLSKEVDHVAEKFELAAKQASAFGGAYIDAINKGNKEIDDAVENKFPDFTRAMEYAQDTTAQLDDIFTNTFNNFSDTLADALMSGKANFKDFARSVIRDIARMIARQQALLFYTKAFNFLGGSIFGISLPTPAPRSSGGRVNAGMPYVTGEAGKELFIPQTSGTIIPNNQLSGAGATNINFTINTVDARGVDELLTNRRSTIINVINDALNRQGKEALV